MTERTPMETLREIETLLEHVGFDMGCVCLPYAKPGDGQCGNCASLKMVADARVLLRELREGAVEGYVAPHAITPLAHFVSTYRFYEHTYRFYEDDVPALLLTTKPRVVEDA